MIKQNHLSQFAAVTSLFVVLLGSGIADAKDKPRNKGSDHHIHHTVNHKNHNHLVVQHTTTKKQIVSRKEAKQYVASGIASWYGYESGNTTATGAKFKPLQMTAAHRTLPLNTKIKVTYLKTNKSVIVLVNDRGPYKGNRLLDLSLGAAKKIGLKPDGIGRVKIEVV